MAVVRLNLFSKILILFHLQWILVEIVVASKDSARLRPSRVHRELSPADESNKIRSVQVHIIHRHGDRTPITPLKDAEFWESTLIPPKMLEKINDGTKLIRREGNSHKAHGIGPFGKLSQMGLLQMVELGNRLREELSTDVDHDYRDDGTGFVHHPYVWNPSRPLCSKNVKIVSTNFARTIQSVQGVLVGLFPDGPDKTIEIDCQNTHWMIPDPQPRNTKEQEELEARLSAKEHIQQRDAELRSLAIRCTDSLRPLLGEGAFDMAFGIGEDLPADSTITGKPLPWCQLAEVTKCLHVRNRLPDSITQEDQETIIQHAAWKWFESLRHPRLSYLAMHKMTQSIVASMENFESEAPVTIYSGHDSTLIGLICAFHLEQPHKWPEYGSFLKIDLFEKHSDGEGNDGKKELFVRFFLNGELLHSHWDGERRDHISLEELSRHVNTEPATQVI